jgi:predicted amidohydrolase YtcJ
VTGLEQTLVTGGRVVTQAGDDTEAVLLVGDRVLATGTAEELAALAPGATRRDYPGATVVPGLDDAHQHLTMTAAQSTGLDLSADVVPDRAALTEALATHAASAPRDGWVIGSRYDHTRTDGGHRITRDELDRIVPGHPAVVVNVGAHWGVANSAALALGGLTDDSPDPPGGELGRDPSGRLDGYLAEQALFDYVYPSLASRPPVAPLTRVDDLAGAVVDVSRDFLAAGLTSVGDAMVGPDELAALQEARGRGLGLRVNALLTYPNLPRLAALGLREGFGDEWLRVGGIKAFADGAVAGRSCAVAEPFEGTDDLGILTTDAERMQSLVADAEAAGVRMAVHANGERAIELVLDAFEAAAARRPAGAPALRHRIEHCSIVTPRIIERMAALRVVAVPFGSYAWFHGDTLLGWYGEERLERMFAHRSLLDAGLTVAGSSDYPCGPWEPLRGLQSCVTRRSRGGRDVGPSQRVTLREALWMYTVGSAAAAGEEHHKGRLAPGHLADLTVLEGDLMAADPDGLGEVPVLATWVGGEPRWEAGG